MMTSSIPYLHSIPSCLRIFRAKVIIRRPMGNPRRAVAPLHTVITDITTTTSPATPRVLLGEGDGVGGAVWEAARHTRITRKCCVAGAAKTRRESRLVHAVRADGIPPFIQVVGKCCQTGIARIQIDFGRGWGEVSGA